MRFSVLLTALWLAGTSLAVAAAPPGYRPPRRFYTARGQAYTRPPLRLHLSANLAYYNGDLTSRLHDQTLRVGYGLGLTQALSPHVTFTADVARVLLKAQDVYPSRGYSFEGSNGVLSALVRYNIFADKSMFMGLNKVPSPLQVFVQAGVSGILYNPTATLGDAELPAESAAGYPAVAVGLPVGLGLTLRASQRLFFTLDGRYCFTSTDLLDDISRRANPKQNDDFATLTFQVEYALGKKKSKPLTHFD